MRQGGAISRGGPQSTQSSLLIFESSSEDASSGKPSLTAQQNLSALSPGSPCCGPCYTHCILSRLCLPPSVGGDQGGSLCVDANTWECLKIQRNTKETKANTCVPAESGSVRQPLDGRGANMTANMASTCSYSRMREHTCLAHSNETCCQTWLYVHSCTSKARAHP